MTAARSFGFRLGGILTMLIPIALAFSIATGAAHAEGRLVQYWVDSGYRDNPMSRHSTVFQQTLEMGADVNWVRLKFAEVWLERDSYLKITSNLDGDYQLLNGRALVEWNYSTSYFNGSSVTVELIAGPGSRNNRVRINRVLVDAGVDERASTSLERSGPTMPQEICGVDDRVLFDDSAVARLMRGAAPVTDTTADSSNCTGFMINQPAAGVDRIFLSAGHCFDNAQAQPFFATVAQFNVPQSGGNCHLRHPPAAKQFAINLASVVKNAGANVEGNDWACFRCFANPNTGKTAFQEQNAVKTLAAAVPAAADTDTTTVRVTGYGSDYDGPAAIAGSCSLPCTNGTRHSVCQTDHDRLIRSQAAGLRHRVDTCGGNSGSPIILVRTGNVIGIHTGTFNACAAVGGYNYGTAITNANLQAALANRPPAIDSTHFWSYSVLDTVDTLITVSVSDQFLPLTSVRIDTLVKLVNWVQKDGSPVTDSLWHFTWWNIKDKVFVPEKAAIDNQFGPQDVILNYLSFLLAPAAKNDTSGSPEGLSHYLCYKTASEPGPFGEHTFFDEWRTDTVVVGRLVYLCAPCLKHHDGVTYLPADTVTHLAVYRIAPHSERFEPFVEDQFDSLSFSVAQLDSEYLFVPSLKTFHHRLGVTPTTIGQPRLWGAPNPGRGRSYVSFSLAEGGPVSLDVMDVGGRRVRILLREHVLPAGEHTVMWDGATDGGAVVATGVYFVRLRAEGRTAFMRIVLIR